MNGKIGKVLILTHDFIHPLQGGGGLRTLYVALEFQRRGFSPVIIAPCEGIKKINGIKVVSVSPPRKQRSQILSCVKFNVRLFFKIFPFLNGVGIIFTHNTISAILLPFLKKIFGFKFLLDITDIHAEYLLVGKRNVLEKLLTPFLLRYEYFVISSADFVTVATKSMRNLLLKKGLPESKIDVVYDGVDLENICSGKLPTADKGIIHLGAIDKQHGVEDIVRCIPLVINQIPDAKFYFVGGGRELKAIKKITKTLDINGNCIFTGILPQDKARKYLQKACIGIISRRKNLPNDIVTTLKIYEYWASGTAVVTTPLRGIREIAQDGCDIMVYNSGDIYDLSEKIIQLLKDSDARNGLISNGLKSVKKFNIFDTAYRIVEASLKFLSNEKF
ncbi:MAG: glycosyltransferase family 4 protein [Candidatus Omnitrophica bacterium]|nr:glycosyltransferase family 4 protein [Candidatus Omnitrophota bacterium]